MNRDECVERTGDEDLVFADGFDDCIIGTASRQGVFFVVYDEDAVIANLAAGGMSHEEAQEYYAYNIERAYVGPRTPLFVSLAPADDVALTPADDASSKDDALQARLTLAEACIAALRQCVPRAAQASIQALTAFDGAVVGATVVGGTVELPQITTVPGVGIGNPLRTREEPRLVDTSRRYIGGARPMAGDVVLDVLGTEMVVRGLDGDGDPMVSAAHRFVSQPYLAARLKLVRRNHPADLAHAIRLLRRFDPGDSDVVAFLADVDQGGV